MVELRDEGLIRSIGVSNFTEEHLRRIIDATGVVPVMNQVELHPYFPQAALRAVHAELGVVTESWSPLGGASCCPSRPSPRSRRRTG
jgi:diketogulonate reductase-like aldo/keto reductase